MSTPMEEKMYAFAALIGRMESTFVRCEKVLHFCQARIYDKSRLAELVVVRNEIQERLREARRLFPDPNEPEPPKAA